MITKNNPLKPTSSDPKWQKYETNITYDLGNIEGRMTLYAWFKDEQLTYNERQKITKQIAGQSYDFVLTHTCPYDWRPTDLFLNFVDSKTVDPTMELWLEELKHKRRGF